MKQVEKTVFISYRRTNAPWALSIFQNLTHHGYDVFFDFHGIASGDFERVILANIKARAHFIVLLTPSSLERCGDPNDLLRREIEEALDSQRNIVPITLEGFDFTTPTIASQLTGKLTTLNRYNALHTPVDYFDEAMKRLREKYLNVPLDTVLHPTSLTAQQVTKTEQEAATSAAPVRAQELTAQEWFEKGFEATGADEEIRCNTEAIRLNPDYAFAYINRGIVRFKNGNLKEALQDYDDAIRLNPDHAFAYNNRGLARFNNGDLKGALRDYDDAIRLNPDYVNAYYNRAELHEIKDNYRASVVDLQEYLDLGGGDKAETEKRIRNLRKGLNKGLLAG